MTMHIEWKRRAQKECNRMDSPTRHRVIEALERLAETGHGDLKKLKGVHPPRWRLRVGDWRVILSLQAEAGTILVLRVLPRDKAY